MKQDTQDNIMAFICGLLLFCCILLGAQHAHAGGYTGDVTVHKKKYEGNTWDNSINQEQTTESNSESISASQASSDNAVTVEGDRVENNSSNVVLVPNNNTENCLRVFGIAWGKNGESGALGVPWRSKKCDFEQAADDAFAAGERELGWWWKCQNKNLYKPFYSREPGGDRGEAKAAAIDQCHAKAVGEVNNLNTIDRLRDQLKTVNEQRQAEARNCKESMGRVTAAWRESCGKN